MYNPIDSSVIILSIRAVAFIISCNLQHSLVSKPFITSPKYSVPTDACSNLLSISLCLCIIVCYIKVI